ncbi:hypothetical protein [Sorangium sp. So ce406]
MDRVAVRREPSVTTERRDLEASAGVTIVEVISKLGKPVVVE